MSERPGAAGRIIFESIDSTNEEAKRRVAAGEIGPLWIAARQQLAARGRQGRPWATEPGNLAVTLLLPWRGTLAEAARLGFPAALAVADLLAIFAPKLRISVKWPNDVLLVDRKVTGILLENFGSNPDGTLRVAMGIGVNLAHHPKPDATRWAPTSIAREIGHAPDFDIAFEVLAGRVGHWLNVLEKDGFAAIRKQWLARADRLGQQIEARLPQRTLTGRFVDMDEDGALVLETADGTHRISAGEIYWEGPDAARH